MDWFEKNGAVDRGWSKINSKLVIDFGSEDEIRLKHLKYIVTRFLVSEKKTEYIVVTNSERSRQTKSYLLDYAMKLMESDSDLWPYRLSFRVFQELFSTFFKDAMIQLKMYTKQSYVIKLEIIPLMLGSRELLWC